MTPATPSSGLVPNLPPLAPFVPPSRDEWDLVFQPVFDEFFTPPAKESHDLEVAHMSNDPYFGIPIPETIFEESSSSNVIPTTVHSDAPISEHLRKSGSHNSIKNDLRKLKGKEISDNVAQVSNATTIALEMYKLDLVILAPKVKNKREAHEYYLKHTMEQAAILREVVEQAKSRNPLDSASYSACMYVRLIQELLGYVRDTCPVIHTPSKKLVAVTPINKKKTDRFADTITSSGNIPKVTNRPLLSSAGVNPSTSTSGSEPSGNTKNDRISRTPISNEKNKVEVL
ncbi:hypothetical protein Tco_0623376 [Tanacetum coccineum]